MKHSIYAAPTQEPVSLAEFKAHAHLDSADSDAIGAGYLIAARQWAETLSGRVLMTQTLDAYFDSFDCLDLPRGPAQSVTSVSYIDTAGVTQVVASAYYALNNRDRINSVDLLPSYTWPQPMDRKNAVTVRYVAGYGSVQGAVPEEIRHAILMKARFLLDGNEADQKAAESLLEQHRVRF